MMERSLRIACAAIALLFSACPLRAADAEVVGSLRWYPSENLIAAELAFSKSLATRTPPMLKVAYANGSVVGTWKLPRTGSFVESNGRVIVHDKVEMPKTLREGRAVATLEVGGKAVMRNEFIVKRYPWFHTKVGKADILLPGFTPVTLAGNKIGVVGRTYAIGKNGLPSSMVSLGEQVLAGPVAITAESGGVSSQLTGGEVKFRRSSDTTAEYLSRGSRMSVRGRVEQDGLLKMRISFPETLRAERIYMDIPVKREYAELYHACLASEIRTNPGGFIPAGTGRVFGSRDIRRRGGKKLGGCDTRVSGPMDYAQAHIDNFIPYCWVGADDRGVLFAADNDKGWIHCEERDAVELLRDDKGNVSIRLNFVNGKARSQAKREIEICLQASPVKPMPDGWRGWAETYTDCECTRALKNLASNPTWGCYIVGTARYPTFMDFDHVRELRRTIETGRMPDEYIAKWVARCKDAYDNDKAKVPWLAEKESREAAFKTLEAHAHAEFYTAKCLHGRPNPCLFYYTCDVDPCKGLYEMPVMKDEWTDYVGVYGSHMDYAIYYLDKMIEAGMGGVYNDNAFFFCNYDWVVGGAWVDDEGRLHPSFSLYALREFCRREAVTMVQRKIKPWITIHHTNANILPTISFATSTMGMEWKYGNQEYQDRYTPDYMRAVNQGLQAGVYPTSLEGIFETKTKEEGAWLTRTMLAAFLPHEIRPSLQYTGDYKLYIALMDKMQKFGIAEKDCVYTAYWDKANPVKSPRKDVMVSTYRRPGKMLLVIGSYANEDVGLRLKMPGIVKKAVDLESGNSVDLSALQVRRRDFKVVEVSL